MIRRISVRAIVVHEGKLLCVRLNPYRGSLRAESEEYWCLPGGGLDEGESLTDGAIREMVEETGIKPELGKLSYVQQFIYEDKDYIEFFFNVKNVEDYLNIDLSKTTHGELEIAEIAFVNPADVVIKPEFLATEPLMEVIASNGPTRVISRL
ncbi:MAG TPA: NUDIX hydrolase [Candidatus Saccharimonadales bacterium]|nr:NUDIX hydrolase [Candidatus Saccharimonadales bacterium]